ncbi:MAG: TRAP transporter small permease [Clostridium sp.]|nr:TRAP transporter small permease [Clostridium sp.]
MKLLKSLDKNLEEVLCVVILAAMTLVIFIQIIIRQISSFVKLPMAWSEEIGRYLFIYAVYVGAALATKKLAHQKVDILPLLVGEKGKLIFNLISDIGVIIFAGVMAYYGWQVMWNIAAIRVQKAPATHLNMGLAYIGPALGMTLCGIRSIQNIIFHIRMYKDQVGTSKEGGKE